MSRPPGLVLGGAGHNLEGLYLGDPIANYKITSQLCSFAPSPSLQPAYRMWGILIHKPIFSNKQNDETIFISPGGHHHGDLDGL